MLKVVFKTLNLQDLFNVYIFQQGQKLLFVSTNELAAGYQPGDCEFEVLLPRGSNYILRNGRKTMYLDNMIPIGVTPYQVTYMSLIGHKFTPLESTQSWYASPKKPRQERNPGAFYGGERVSSTVKHNGRSYKIRTGARGGVHRRRQRQDHHGGS